MEHNNTHYQSYLINNIPKLSPLLITGIKSNQLKPITRRLHTVFITKPIYKTHISNKSKNIKPPKKKCSDTTKSNRKQQSQHTNNRLKSETPLFNKINTTAFNTEVNQLSSSDNIKQTNPHQTITAKDEKQTNQIKAEFLRQEIILLPLKRVTFRFSNPALKAKMNHYLNDFPKITLLSSHNNFSILN